MDDNVSLFFEESKLVQRICADQIVTEKQIKTFFKCILVDLEKVSANQANQLFGAFDSKAQLYTKEHYMKNIIKAIEKKDDSLFLKLKVSRAVLYEDNKQQIEQFICKSLQGNEKLLNHLDANAIFRIVLLGHKDFENKDFENIASSNPFDEKWLDKIKTTHFKVPQGMENKTFNQKMKDFIIDLPRFFGYNKAEKYLNKWFPSSQGGQKQREHFFIQSKKQLFHRSAALSEKKKSNKRAT